MSGNAILLLIFLPPLKTVITLICLGDVEKQVMGWIWPTGHSLSNHVFTSEIILGLRFSYRKVFNFTFSEIWAITIQQM